MGSLPFFMETVMYEQFNSNLEDVKNLFGSEVYASLLENHQHSGNDPLPVVKLFCGGSATWLLTEIEPNSDRAFGLCDLGMGFPELGYVSICELLHVKVPIMMQFGETKHKVGESGVEVDKFFSAKAPISEYAKQARIAGHIVEDWPDLEELPVDVISEESDGEMETVDEHGHEILPLSQFLTDYSKELLQQVERQTPVFFNGEVKPARADALNELKRPPFEAQAHRINACVSGLLDAEHNAVFLNGEMGTGKTFMGIAVSHLLYREYTKKPTLVISPPHLVYKWRREILDTLDDVVVHVINGSNAIHQLIALREQLIGGSLKADGKHHFVIIGRVRMRMGFYWRPAYFKKRFSFLGQNADGYSELQSYSAIACPKCGNFQIDSLSEMPVQAVDNWGSNHREVCQHCNEPLWTMRHRVEQDIDEETKVRQFLLKLPGIGKVSADKLLNEFGVDTLLTIIDDNIYDFVNISKADGEFYFSDKQAVRLEKAMGRLEFALRVISYQPSEFIKRYFPRKTFGLALIDEAHEYKNQSSAQGQAMAVLCGESEKVLPLTGTLMGGYASDLFHLLFRAMPSEMVKMGYKANHNNSFASAEMQFMRSYGCLIDVYKTTDEGAHKTARGRKVTTNVKKAPGFSPLGIAQFILPYTVFMRLSDLGDGVLPAFDEETRMIAMTGKMEAEYKQFRLKLLNRLHEALCKGDKSLTGTVVQALLRWPDTCFRAETVTYPRDRSDILAEVGPMFADDQMSPKEVDLVNFCIDEKSQHRRVLVFTTYTGKHDTAMRLKKHLDRSGLKSAVLRSTVKTDEREDWINDKVAQGIDVIICNPELVKTGLDLLAFPSLYFMQTGYNVYTIAQASRRSWRIGQTEDVKVCYAGYAMTAQQQCMELMAKKIKAALSTQGVMPETGLDIFDEADSETSLSEALAKSLLK